MDSDIRNGCSHPLGFPIRKSPDHSLLAASRGLSQLTTSFFAFLRLGIHTHALSSLTITSTSHTTHMHATSFFALTCAGNPPPYGGSDHRIMPVNIKLSKISVASTIGRTCSVLRIADFGPRLLRGPGITLLVGPGGIEPPTSPL